MASTAGDISRENLKRHGIIYDEKVCTCDHGDNSTSSRPISSLPENVRAMRDGLLEFSHLIPDDSEDLFHDEFVQYGSEVPETDCLQPPPAAYFSQKYGLEGASEQLNTIAKIEECVNIAERARKRTKAKEAEPNWTCFLRHTIFRDSDAKNRSRTKNDILFDQWSLHEDIQWNEFPSWQEPISGIQRRTVPKPDLTYGFPITSEKGEGFSRDEYVQSFSLNVLGKLYSNGVRSAVTTGLRKWTEEMDDDNPPKAHDLLCYPWAIVEVKHCQVPKTGIEKCYCQAANASAAALSLQEQLLSSAFGDIPGTLSPIIAFTCIGPRIKVWLTYRWQESTRQVTKMSCILSTSVELTWGVVVLRRIEQNMHFWASRILKPKVFAAISRIREKLNHAAQRPMRTVQDHPHLVIQTPPATPLARNKQKSPARSPSVQSRQATKSNPADCRSLNDSIAAASNDRILNSNNESEHTASEASETENDDRYTTSERNEKGGDRRHTISRRNEIESDEREYTTSERKKIGCDRRHTLSIRNKTESNRRYTTSETNETESDEREYTTSKRNEMKGDRRYPRERNKKESNRRYLTSQTSETESDEREYTASEPSGTESEETDDGYDSNSRDGYRKRNRVSECSYQELKNKVRFSPLICLSGSMFARLVSIKKWFKGLPIHTKVNVVYKLLDPSNGGLSVSNLTRANKRRLKRLLKILNSELEHCGSDSITLTKKSLGDKNKRRAIWRGIDLSSEQPQALRTCFRCCLYLHSGEGCTIYDILADDLETLSVKDRKKMEKEAYKKDPDALLRWQALTT